MAGSLAIWAGIIVLTAYGMRTLSEYKTRQLSKLRETYDGLLMIVQGAEMAQAAELVSIGKTTDLFFTSDFNSASISSFTLGGSVFQSVHGPQTVQKRPEAQTQRSVSGTSLAF